MVASDASLRSHYKHEDCQADSMNVSAKFAFSRLCIDRHRRIGCERTDLHKDSVNAAQVARKTS